jgi:hypothetical protein
LVSFRGHLLSYKTKAPASYKDPITNKWVAVKSEEVVSIPCRYQTNGDAKSLNLVGGELVVYKGEVFYDKKLPIIQVGVEVTITDGNDVLIKSTVIQFIKGNLKSHKLYV